VQLRSYLPVFALVLFAAMLANCPAASSQTVATPTFNPVPATYLAARPPRVIQFGGKVTF